MHSAIAETMPFLWVALVAAPAVAVLVWIWPHIKRASPPPGIPILTGTETTDYRLLIEEQYTKVSRGKGGVEETEHWFAD